MGRQLLLVIVAAAVAALHGWGPWRRAADRLATVARRAIGRPGAAMLVAAGVSVAVNLAYAAVHGLPVPLVHDEYSYLVAADTFAHGRVTNPTPPLYEHFEVPNVLMRPTYQSKYPPGQGLVLAVGEATTGRPIVGMWACAAAAAAAVCWAALAFVPGGWAAAAGVVAACGPQFLHWNQDYWGGTVALLGGAVVVGGWARLMAGPPRAGLAVGLAVGLGVLANTRPFEGLCFAVPLVAGLAWRIAHRSAAVPGWFGRIFVPAAAVLLPVGAAMAYYNFRVTGHPLRVAYQAFSDQYGVFPKMWALPTMPVPHYHDLMMRKVYAAFERGDYDGFHSAAGIARGTAERAGKFLLMNADPYALLVPLAFAVVPLWRGADGRLRWLAAGAAMTFAGVWAETFFLVHYAAPASAGVLVLLVVGWQRLSRRRPGVARGLAVAVVVGVGVAIARPILAEARVPARAAVVAAEPRLATGRHLVFLRYSPDRSMNDEWAYNTADLAAQRVVWARAENPVAGDTDFASTDADVARLYPGRQVWLMTCGRSTQRLDPYAPADRR